MTPIDNATSASAYPGITEETAAAGARAGKSQALAAKVRGSLERLTAWVEGHDYKAYDPGDGNNSYLHALTFNNLFLERVLQQSIMRCPWNIRPVLGVRPHTSTKGMGYLGWGYARMFAATKDPRYEERAQRCLQWVLHHRSPNYGQYCWGNHFSFSTRGGKLPKLEPTIVWTSLIGQALLDAYELWGRPAYLEAAASAADWIMHLPREETATGCCLSYVARRQNSVHNANMLGAALLARVGKLMRHPETLQVAQEAMLYSCTRQRPDGAWFYGEHPQYHWIDNFHTGYNLDSLKRYQAYSGDRTFDYQWRRGYAYFEKTFFEPDGRPRYYHNQRQPVDIQCAAQAIDTFTLLADDFPGALELACRVADWTLENMQDADGHFYYRHLGWMRAKMAMFHWGQGTMTKALAALYQKLSA